MSASKTIFITGASSGIGLASAKFFLSKGWNVVATMRNPSSDHELAQIGDPRIIVQRLDLQDLDSIQPAIDAGIKEYKVIDVLLNNAGFAQGGLFEAISREQVQAQFDVNLFGLMDVTRAILPHFRENNGGGVINVSSGAGFWSLPMMTMYNASKFALEGFTEALSYELASQNIFVKSVIPHGGVTNNNFLATFGSLTARDASLTPSYGEFVKKTGESFQKMVSRAAITSEDVAATIYTAVTDGKSQLRYFVGEDERGFLKARYSSKDDVEYMAFMRSFFK